MTLEMTNKQVARQTRDLNTIKNAVAFAYEIFPRKLYSETRNHEIVVPRQIAMYLCREITKASFPDVARAFDKTHGTIMHACNVVTRDMKTDQVLATRVKTLRDQIETGLREEAAKQL